MNQLRIHPIPENVVKNNDFTVMVRNSGGQWQEVIPWKVNVDMHDVRQASMVCFDFNGDVEIKVISNVNKIEKVDIRPLSYDIKEEHDENQIIFKLDKACNISVEINGDIFRNLHIFAGEVEKNIPDKKDSNVIYVSPGDHIAPDLYVPLTTVNPETGLEPDVLYFGAGIHTVKGNRLYIPSNKEIYIEGGAALCFTLYSKNNENIKIAGRGTVYLFHEPWETHMSGMTLINCKNIEVEGITFLNPSANSIGVIECLDIKIRNIKSFSCMGWSDGINFYSSNDCLVEGVFMRNSDDCITVYGSRKDGRGGCKNIHVKNSTLWADVAHPTFIGTHGAYDANGDILEDITFKNIDILNHHEIQENYLGCMAINAGDGNTVRNVLYEDIRVEDFERGCLIDIRVFHNEKYNPIPGKLVENISFKNISYNGRNEIPSRIRGFDKDRVVKNVKFDNLVINGKRIESANEGNMIIGDFVDYVTFTV